MSRRPDHSMVNAFCPDTPSDLSGSVRALLARRDRLLGPAYRLFYTEPLHLVRSQDVWLFDHEGRRYLDAYNNVAGVGHCHPRVVDAISAQAALLNTHTRYLHETILDYAEALLGKFPPDLSHVMFTCSGSEANDLALRIAKAYTGGEGLIVTDLAYHGVTDAVSRISPSLGPHIPRSPTVHLTAAPNKHGGVYEVGTAFADGVKAAIDAMRNKGIKPAALICDTVFSSDGVYTDPAGFLRPAVQAIREAGGLFIADEVQAGFGRTGDGFWGFERHDVVPDLVTMGKPMGNGHPIAGVAMKPELVAEFGAKARYMNTFGGNPVSCAAAMATLQVIEDEGLVANAAAVGRFFNEELRQLSERHGLIGGIRGAGLFIGIDLVSGSEEGQSAAEVASGVVNGLRRRGILLSATGPGGNVLKIRPPLTFKREHASMVLEALDDELSALTKQ